MRIVAGNKLNPEVGTIRYLVIFFLVLACLLVPCLLVSTVIEAKEYSFAWSANPEPVEGYRLYYKKGGDAAPPFDGIDALDGPSPIDLGKQTSYTITGLDESATYHFALTAYNGTDESGYTEVVTAYGDTTTAPPPSGSKAFIFSLENIDTTDTTAFRVYLNDQLLCESATPTEPTITCYADLLNEVMHFTVTSVDSSGVESSKSSALVFDPSQYPQLFKTKKVILTWEYDSSDTSVSGFNIYHNNNLLCDTTDPTARQLSCEFTIETTNIFSVTAIDTTGIESPVSNSLTYIVDSTTSETDTLTASFTTSGQEGTAPYSVTFDATPSTGMIESYSWAFGDGETTTGQTATHSYLSPGSYSAILTVTSTSNVATQSSAIITVTEQIDDGGTTEQPPVAVITTNTTAAGEAPLTVQFDSSGSSATQQPITSYSWGFGEGTSDTGATTSHTYNFAGSYNASLTVTDAIGLTDTTTTPVIVESTSTSVNAPPISSFTTSATAGTAPLTVSFYGTSSSDSDGSINEYLWSFGDGTSTTGSLAQHTFHYMGDYTVTLKVTDDQGSTALSSITISIMDQSEIPFYFELLEADADHNWIRLEFDKEFFNPVVVAGPPSYNDPEPTTVRVRNVDTTGFEVRLQEWEYQDGAHAPETLSFLVMERGAHTTDDGGKIEAGTFSGATSFKRIDLQQAYGKTPIILSQVITENEADAVVGRLRNTTTDSFEYTMQEHELTPTAHGAETIGYIAWEPGEGEVWGLPFKAAFTAQIITDSWSDLIPLNESPASPLLIAQLQTNIESGPAALRSRSTPTSLQIKVEEETSADEETIHMAEVVGSLIIGVKAAAGDLGSASSLIKNFIFTWESTTSTNIAGYRFYLNGSILCESTDPAARQHTCKAALLNETMHFSMTSVLSTGTETEPSAILRISPDDYPDLFGIHLAAFEWQYDSSAESSIAGFSIYNNDNLICETMNPSDRKLTCKVQIDSRGNAFSIRARALNGTQIDSSSTLQYTPW